MEPKETPKADVHWKIPYHAEGQQFLTPNSRTLPGLSFSIYQVPDVETSLPGFVGPMSKLWTLGFSDVFAAICRPPAGGRSGRRRPWKRSRVGRSAEEVVVNFREAFDHDNENDRKWISKGNSVLVQAI